jgi:hypothetical protein
VIDKLVFFMTHDLARRNAIEAIKNAPPGWMVVISEPSRTISQNEKFHAMNGDLAKQLTFASRRLDTESWKRLTVDQFESDVYQKPSLVIPSIDHQRVVTLGTPTRSFGIKKACDYITWIYAFGIDQGVKFKERALQIYEEALRMRKAA